MVWKEHRIRPEHQPTDALAKEPRLLKKCLTYLEKHGLQ